MYVLVSPPVPVMRTLATFVDSFQVRRVLWPASIAAGVAAKLVTEGFCPICTDTVAFVGNGGDAGVQDPAREAVRV